MSNEQNKITPAGLKELKREVEATKEQRPTLIKALQHARSLGDLSENAEYSSAKRDLRHLESRLRFLNKKIQYAEVVASPVSTNKVKIGHFVTVEFLDDADQVTYQIVGQQEVDLKQAKISLSSPLGKALLNHRVDDVISIKAPAGDYQVKIIGIKNKS